MVDRFAPFLILVINQFLVGFLPLFGLAVASDEILPRLGPCLVALTIWSVPDLVRMQRSARSDAQAPQLYKTVLNAIKRGWLFVGIALACSALIALFLRPFPWHIAGFAAFLIAGFVEARHLRRQLDSLAVLDNRS